jgi:ABC-type phosphate transport system permease subunit
MLTAAELDALRLSLQVALVAVAASLPLAVLAAWVLARLSFPGKSLVDAVVHLPLVLPPVVIGYFLLLVFGTKGPLGAWLYEVFGIRLIFTRWGAALAAAVMSFPLMVRAIRLALEAVDRRLEAAARTLGATRLDVFFSVTLPLMLPRLRRHHHLRRQRAGRDADAVAGDLQPGAVARRRCRRAAPGADLAGAGGRCVVRVRTAGAARAQLHRAPVSGRA